jgi:hypothetical protein
MAFPVAAVVGGVLGIGSSLLGASASNKEAKAQAERQRAANQMQWLYDVMDWQRQNAIAQSQWEWDMARIGQLREVEVQKAQDQANYASLLIKNASTNLAINQDALADRFVTEERLRGEQVGMEYAYGQDKLKSDYQFQATQVAIDQLEQSRQYLNQIDLLGNQSNATLQRYENETRDLMASLTLDEARDNLGYQLQAIAAMEQDGRLAAVTSAQQGGGATSQRLAITAAQAAGRTYAELDIKARGREQKAAMANSTMRDETNAEMVRISLQMQDAVERGDYSANKANRDQALLANNYERDSTYQANILDKLTIPGFGLAQKQYGRELASLQLGTEAKLYEASLPYRQAPFLDPLKPVPGLMPMYTEVGTVKSGFSGGQIGSALVNGLGMANSWQQSATGKGLFG